MSSPSTGSIAQQSLNLSRCNVLIDNGDITTADPDISGVGVITAFIFSAYITLITVIVAYMFGLVDDGLLRPIDRLVLRAPSRATKHPKVHVALRKAILALSDQQIVTGIAILGAGFQGLRTSSINVYHFQIVIYLAWMSSSVHLSALTILRPFLHFHRGVMAWRLMGMLALLIMLMIALVPTISNDFAVVSVYGADVRDNMQYTDFGVPAICFWGNLWGDGINPDSILSFCVLFVSYFWKMGGMFLNVRNAFQCVVRNPIDHLLEVMLSSVARRYKAHYERRWFWLWLFRLSLAIYLPLTALLETLASFSAALWLSTLGLIYGTMQILIPRSIMQITNPAAVEAENQMGFGQLVPLILLVQPLGSVSEHLWLGETDDEQVYQDHHGHTDPHNCDLGNFQDGKYVVDLPEKPLIDYMATYKTPGWTATDPQRIQLRAFMYTSRLFHFLALSVHLATACTAALVFWTDYQTVGYISSQNWYFISFGVAAWVAAAPVTAFVLSPRSRLGQHEPNRKRALYDRERARRSLAHDFGLEPVDDERPEFESNVSPTTAELGHIEHGNSTLELSPTAKAADTLPTVAKLDAREGEVWASELRRRSHSSIPQPVLPSSLTRLSGTGAYHSESAGAPDMT